MHCQSCKGEARWVVNGASPALQYWYCETCKDEVRETTAPRMLSQSDIDQLLAEARGAPYQFSFNFSTDDSGTC